MNLEVQIAIRQPKTLAKGFIQTMAALQNNRIGAEPGFFFKAASETPSLRIRTRPINQPLILLRARYSLAGAAPLGNSPRGLNSLCGPSRTGYRRIEHCAVQPARLNVPRLSAERPEGQLGVLQMTNGTASREEEDSPVPP